MSSTNRQLRSLVTPEGAFILDIKNNSLITLDPVGGFVWERLQQGKTVEQIVSDLVRETGCDPEMVEGGVNSFLDDLKAARLLAI